MAHALITQNIIVWRRPENQSLIQSFMLCREIHFLFVRTISVIKWVSRVHIEVFSAVILTLFILDRYHVT